MTTTPEESSNVDTRLAVLETQIEGVHEGQRQIIARLDSMQQANDARSESIDRRFEMINARIDSLNGRFDRLFYAILALGIAAIGTLIALEKVF